jgi:acetone carboxylase gamma subunit
LIWNLRRGAVENANTPSLLVFVRDPREIHRPILNPDKYEYTFAPDPAWVQIVEYYCSGCGTMVEVEYLPPGHPPLYDMEFDIDALKGFWQGRKENGA